MTKNLRWNVCPWMVGLLIMLSLACIACDIACGDEPVNLFEVTAAVSADAASDVPPVDLFCSPPSTYDSPSPTAIDLFGCDAEPAPTITRQVKATREQAELQQPIGRSQLANDADQKPTRRRSLLWSPTWCGVCQLNANVVGTGNDRMKVELHKGDETTFPAEVQAFANGIFPNGTALAGQQRGWPVWQIERADGGWSFAHHARTLSELVAISELKPGEEIPISNFARQLAPSQTKPIVVLRPVQPTSLVLSPSQ